jgi:hypothetical protein
MTETCVETFTRKEIQERFKKLFGRETTPSERKAFFLFDDNDDAALHELGSDGPAADVNSQP